MAKIWNEILVSAVGLDEDAGEAEFADIVDDTGVFLVRDQPRELVASQTLWHRPKLAHHGNRQKRPVIFVKLFEDGEAVFNFAWQYEVANQHATRGGKGAMLVKGT